MRESTPENTPLAALLQNNDQAMQFIAAWAKKVFYDDLTSGFLCRSNVQSCYSAFLTTLATSVYSEHNNAEYDFWVNKIKETDENSTEIKEIFLIHYFNRKILASQSLLSLNDPQLLNSCKGIRKNLLPSTKTEATVESKESEKQFTEKLNKMLCVHKSLIKINQALSLYLKTKAGKSLSDSFLKKITIIDSLKLALENSAVPESKLSLIRGIFLENEIDVTFADILKQFKIIDSNHILSSEIFLLPDNSAAPTVKVTQSLCDCISTLFSPKKSPPTTPTTPVKSNQHSIDRMA